MGGGSEFVLHWYCIRIVINCIPIGGAGREGTRSSYCMLIVFPLRFCCVPIEGGGKEKEEEFALNLYCMRIVFILYSYCIPIPRRMK